MQQNLQKFAKKFCTLAKTCSASTQYTATKWVGHYANYFSLHTCDVMCEISIMLLHTTWREWLQL